MSKTTKTQSPKTTVTREEWLHAAVDAIRPMFAAIQYPLPADFQVSCGFPGGGSARKRIGECWSTRSNGQNVAHVFISPVLDKPEDVIATLIHECVHVVDDCKSGHKAPFARIARELGLTGKMTATIAGPELAETIKGLVAEIESKIGAYPHKAISLSRTISPKVYHKAECKTCGYWVRTNRKQWEDVGAPLCAGDITHGFLDCRTLDEPGNVFEQDAILAVIESAFVGLDDIDDGEE